MHTRSLRFVLGTLSLAVLVSCSSPSEGSPKPVPTSDTEIETTDSTPPSSDGTDPGNVDLPYSGAPKVDNPLDTAKFEQDPCQSITAAQAQELNVNSPGEQREQPLGQACTWPSKVDRTAEIEIAFISDSPYGLSALYKANEDGKYVFFDELDPIEGYPAVRWGPIDERDTGACNVDVGAADNLAFDIAVQLSSGNVGKKDPCETAAMIAGMALQTIKGAQ